MPMRTGFFLALLGVLPWLSGCENNAAAYMVDGRNHAITLVREQPYPFSSEVKQAIVPARFPVCQRRFDIAPGTQSGPRMELWQLRDTLFVARQGRHWYAIGTEQCQVQKMEPTGDTPPGRLLGSYRKTDGALVFEPVATASAPARR